MSLVITGASGHLGQRVAEVVLDRAEPSEVVLVTRDPSRLAELAGGGAEVRAGDFGDPGSLADAFAGATKVLIISTDRVGDRVAGHMAAIGAAAAASAGAALATGQHITNEGDGRLSYVSGLGARRGRRRAGRERWWAPVPSVL